MGSEMCIRDRVVLVRHPYSMYIMVNDVPKVENLAKTFPAAYRDKPVLVN